MKVKIECHNWTDDHVEFLKNNVKGITTKELTVLFNKHFNLELTHSQVQCKKKNLKLRNGVVTRFKKGQKSYPRGVGYQHIFTKTQLKFLTKNANLDNWVLTQKFNKTFNTNLTRRKIISAKSRHNIKGVVVYSTRYISGFKKGYVPPRWKPLGAEVVDKFGYTWVKVYSDKANNNFKQKHRLIYEKAHGEIPKGHNVVFLDRNIKNFDIENLTLVSNAELATMNSVGLFSKYPEITKSGLTLARVMLKGKRLTEKGRSDK